MKVVGALWRKNSKKAGDYYTGTLSLGVLGEVNIAIFKNEKKDPDSKEPDLNLVTFSEKEGK